MLRNWIIVICLFTSSVVSAQFIPKEGFVPDEQTAIKIAEAVWIPIYGKSTIEKEKPYVAKLVDGIWIVDGTLNCPEGERCKGGAAHCEISKEDGRILKVIHYK